MKKAFLMVLACLLLAGCGAPSETVTPTDSRPDSALAETRRSLFQPRLPNPRRQPPRRNPSPPPPW